MLLHRLVGLFCVFLFLSAAPLSLWAAESAAGSDMEHAEHAEVAGAPAHHELTLYAPPIKQVGPLAITNSMVVTWAVAIGLIVFAQMATRNIQQVPSGIQNFWEWLVESLRDFLEGIIGHDLVKKTFWFFASIFIFVLFCNWVGLIPGVGTIGWGHKVGGRFVMETPLFRGANADLNLTFAMAVVFFACWLIWAIQSVGPIGFLKHLFAPKGESTGALKLLLVVVFAAVGLLEIVSILFRPISLSLRLFGNVFAGETMLEKMGVLVPSLGWLIPIPFYFMELLVGLVQAMVFMLLTAVFTLLICEHEEGH